MLKWIVKALNRESKSKSIAKDRLQLILVQDRAIANEKVMESLQAELTTLLLKYFELEPDHIEMDLHRQEESIALIANIPVFGFKTRRSVRAEAHAALQAESDSASSSSKPSTATATPSL